MVLTPEDIANKDFSRSVRGFNENEVNDFLDEINDNYARTLDENVSLKNQLSAAQEKVKYFSGLQDALNKSILIAQQTADRVKKDAEKERDRIIYDAENDAKKVLKAATEKANQIQAEAIGETQELSDKGKVIEAGLKKFHQDLIDTFKQQLEYANDDNWVNLLQSHFSENFDEFKKYKASQAYDDVTKSLLSENPDLKLDVAEPAADSQSSQQNYDFDQQASQFTQQYDQNQAGEGAANEQFGGSQGQFVNPNDPVAQGPDQAGYPPVNSGDQQAESVVDSGFNNINSQNYADPYNFNQPNSDLGGAGLYYPGDQPNNAAVPNQPYDANSGYQPNPPSSGFDQPKTQPQGS
ncbi:DivIVA domain-containing protein [Xylocopilactobacillus apicola]|uniref:DivIVA domain-containing protein n=1 Tax=Xylocopilactobacillus apicola TaxID=2932184 RepID=A0AAU9CWF4_9LACO|nr:DivIVA domain-containing protein [Xylocopilactobacillus apicola]BDR58312.1 hypothetical protein XA3_07530 [Xylocopilactobacillus apicola]